MSAGDLRSPSRTAVSNGIPGWALEVQRCHRDGWRGRPPRVQVAKRRCRSSPASHATCAEKYVRAGVPGGWTPNARRTPSAFPKASTRCSRAVSHADSSAPARVTSSVDLVGMPRRLATRTRSKARSRRASSTRPAVRDPLVRGGLLSTATSVVALGEGIARAWRLTSLGTRLPSIELPAQTRWAPWGSNPRPTD